MHQPNSQTSQPMMNQQPGAMHSEHMHSHDRSNDREGMKGRTGLMTGQKMGQGFAPNNILVRREHKEKRTSVRDLCISLVSLQDLSPIVATLNPAMRLLNPSKDGSSRHDHIKHPVEFKMTDEGYYEVELKESMQEHFQDLVFLTIVDKLGGNGYRYKYHYDQVAGTTNHKREVFVYQQRDPRKDSGNHCNTCTC